MKGEREEARKEWRNVKKMTGRRCKRNIEKRNEEREDVKRVGII